MKGVTVGDEVRDAGIVGVIEADAPKLADEESDNVWVMIEVEDMLELDEEEAEAEAEAEEEDEDEAEEEDVALAEEEEVEVADALDWEPHGGANIRRRRTVSERETIIGLAPRGR